MKVTINWSEQVGYESTIEVDETVVIQALGLPAGTQLTKEEIFQYLTNNYDNDEILLVEEDWFEQCDTISDFVSVDDRQIDRVVSFESG
jgi:hypothetical protein